MPFFLLCATCATNDSSSSLPREDIEEGLCDAAWDQVAAAAYQLLHAPEQLFHLLDKNLLLKNLRKLTAEQTVNGKAFYKTYGKWEGLSQTQRNKKFPSGFPN